MKARKQNLLHIANSNDEKYIAMQGYKIMKNSARPLIHIDRL